MIPQFVGREPELRWLEEAIERESAAVVVGEAGIGKSTLMAEFAARAPGGASFVPCVASLRWLPYLPLRLALNASVTGDVAGAAVAVRRWLRGGVLVLDDADAADEYTLAVVALLVGRVPLAISLRAGLEVEGVVAAAGLGNAPRLELGPLSDEALAALADARAPHLTSAQRTARVRAAAGNPLFLLEGSEDESFGVGVRVRLRALPADGRRALLLLALLGRPAPSAWLGSGVDQLLAERLAVPEGNDLVVVRHALIAEHALALATDQERRRLCRELARLVGDPGEASRLLEAAGDNERARTLAARAAAITTGVERGRHLALEARLSTGDARSHLIAQACLELLDSGDARGARMLLSAAPEVVAAARAGGPGAADLLLASALANWELGDPEAAARDAAEGRAHADGSNSLTEVRLVVLQAQPVIWQWDAEAATPFVERASEVAIRAGTGQVDALTLQAQQLYVAGRGDAARERAAVAYALATAGGKLRELSTAGLMYGLTLLQTDRQLDGFELLEGLMPRLREAGLERAALDFEMLLLIFLLFRAPDPALILRIQALLDEPLTRPLAEDSAANLATILVHVGRPEEATRLIDQTTTTTVNAELRLEAARREIALVEGRYDEAVEPAESYSPSLEEIRAWASFMGECSTTLTVKLASDMPVDRAPAEVIAILDRAQRGEAAEADVEGLLAAARTHDASGHAVGGARARWGAGELARRLGLPGARDLLLAAERETAELRLPPLLAQAEQSLRRAGIARRAASSGGATVITPRQQEILDLVAAGYRSPQIAARLGISRSTVDRLIGAASRSLNARNRLHAAASQIATGRGYERDQPRPEAVAIVERARAADLTRWQRERRTWKMPPPPIMRLDEQSDEHVLLEAARGGLLGIVLSGDAERDDRFIDDLRRLRTIERYHADEPLSPRCVALAELLAAGHALEHASALLHVSLRTAERDAERLRRVLGARTTVEAVQLLLKGPRRESRGPLAVSNAV